MGENGGPDPATTVLVVDEVPQVRQLLGQALEREGFALQEASDGEEALTIFQACPPDLVVLDINLPKLDGFQLLGRLKRVSAVPVILLTGRGDEIDRILGLELGADDYVVKPFSPREVVARVRAVLRRAESAVTTRRLEFPDLVIDLDERKVLVDGEPVDVTRREFDLLAFLASSPRRVFSREQLLEQVWGSTPAWQSLSTVTEHVRRLRLRLEGDTRNPRHLISVRGVGYRFQP